VRKSASLISAALILLLILFLPNAARAQRGQSAASQPQSTIWRFDHLNSIGGHPTTVLGHPHLIDSPYGKAVEFNGIDDALFVGAHPLAGVSAFTWEVIFRPDAGGAEAQRFFHLQ
jgi:hypothetical protein